MRFLLKINKNYLKFQIKRGIINMIISNALINFSFCVVKSAYK